MAIKDGNFLRGALGPYVFREVHGKQIVSARPSKGSRKQTLNTKKAATDFGITSSLGSGMRKSVRYQLADFYPHNMPNRLVSALAKSVRACRISQSTNAYTFNDKNFQNLIGFEFNTNSFLEYALDLSKVRHELRDRLVVTIPKLEVNKELKFPNGLGYQCNLCVSVTFFRMSDGKRSRTAETKKVTVRRDEQYLQEKVLTFKAPKGCLCMVSIFMEYLTFGSGEDLRSINNKNLNPGAIIAAFITPGRFAGQDEENLSYMLPVKRGIVAKAEAARHCKT